jgi:hypothetical protein
MLTIFTIPKPFIGHIDIIQRNAIKSWLNLTPKCEIILYGDEKGIKEVADEYGIIHVPLIKKNHLGTPFLDYVFTHAREKAKNDFVCYSNADIIIFNDIITAILKINLKKFLMVGKRWDVEMPFSLDTSQREWVQKLLSYAKYNHAIQDFPGMDYFIFPKKMILELPPFVVGRSGWDNWMVYNARRLGISVIDASPVVKVIHQNHSYKHVPHQKGEYWDGPESKENLKLIQKRQMYLWKRRLDTHSRRTYEKTFFFAHIRAGFSPLNPSKISHISRTFFPIGTCSNLWNDKI